ncbi:hypothetical protein GQX73_g7713 [Xylaria multiplex]|uniref:Uncharacterized protein n=1 Tax=Xylaria multiplex TaxID=323545 RepID=A0A7C8MPX3_9PEZI|nr:hypothetical protein GQX73_g7713 [Xylaria multiplex]
MPPRARHRGRRRRRRQRHRARRPDDSTPSLPSSDGDSLGALSLGSPSRFTLASGRVITVSPVPLPQLPPRAPAVAASAVLGVVPAPAPARPTPTTAPRARSAATGLARETPCLRCVKSALRGRSNGVCVEAVGGGQRCWRCASGHLVIRKQNAPLALCAMRLLIARPPARVAQLRTTVRVILELIEEEQLAAAEDDEDDEDDEDNEDDEEEEEEEEEWLVFSD